MSDLMLDNERKRKLLEELRGEHWTKQQAKKTERKLEKIRLDRIKDALGHGRFIRSAIRALGRLILLAFLVCGFISIIFAVEVLLLMSG